MKVDINLKEAWYMHGLVVREKVNAEYRNKIYKEAFGEDSEEYRREIELCNGILGKLDPFFSRRRTSDEMRKV